MKNLLSAVSSGVLLLFSFEPFGLWPMAWIALVPLFHAMLGCEDARSAADLAGVTGLLFYGLSLHWLIKVFGPMAAAFWCVFALWLVLPAALWRRAAMGAPAWRAVVAAGALWAGAEYFRAEVWPLACPWLALGFSQVPCKPLLQLSSLIGVYGLSALVVSANAAFALALRGKRGPALAAVLGLAGAAAWGVCRMADPTLLGTEELKVALIQDESYDLDRMAGLSTAAEALDADLLVWPEYGFSVQAGQESSYAALISRRLRASRAVAILGGATLPEEPRDGGMRNFAWVMAPGGRLLGSYDKLHPIPFIEKYLRPNPRPEPVDTPLGLLGTLICYDLDFEDGARRMAGLGARLLAVPNLDPMEWKDWQHRQHSGMAPMRAVESGLWVARAASSGISQVIDPAGRVKAALPSGRSGVLAAKARLKEGGTPYTRLGWLLAPLCMMFCAVSLAAWMLEQVEERYAAFLTILS
ncbi:MAG: nitrilase-related carbon-nitrogen hydrolase [Elusimicrobiota bacterium]